MGDLDSLLLEARKIIREDGVEESIVKNTFDNTKQNGITLLSHSPGLDETHT